MTLSETYAAAKAIMSLPKRPILSAGKTLRQIPVDASCLSIHHDYEGELPQLRHFSNLTDFSSTKVLSAQYYNEQDLSHLRKLYLTLPSTTETVKLFTPCMEHLTIYISEEESSNRYESYNKEIDLSGLDCLETLVLRHCTGYRIACPSNNHTVKKLICVDYKECDFSFISSFPELEVLTLTGCSISNIDFLRFCPHLKKLDLSYNLISDFSPIYQQPQIEEVNLYRNPCNVFDSDLMRNCKVVISDLDKELERYENRLVVDANMAFQRVHAMRGSESGISTVLKRITRGKTDEELFKSVFASLVKSSFTSSAYCKRLSVGQMRSRAIEKYPFLSDLLDGKSDQEESVRY